MCGGPNWGTSLLYGQLSSRVPAHHPGCRRSKRWDICSIAHAELVWSDAKKPMLDPCSFWRWSGGGAGVVRLSVSPSPTQAIWVRASTSYGPSACVLKLGVAGSSPGDPLDGFARMPHARDVLATCPARSSLGIWQGLLRTGWHRLGLFCQVGWSRRRPHRREDEPSRKGSV